MGRKIFQSERMVSSGFLDRHAPTHTNRLLRQKDIKVILLPENVRGLYPWSYIAVFYELVTGILTLFHRMQLPPSFHVEYLVARDELSTSLNSLIHIPGVSICLLSNP